jgi:protein-S-isoprenylcysteine O-methyltransferase Ste14
MAHATIILVYLLHLAFTVVQVVRAERRREPGTRVATWTTPLLDVARWLTIACCIWQVSQRQTFEPAITACGVAGLGAIALLKRHVFASLGPLWSRHIEVRPNHRLITTGPYAVVRHPHYALNVLELITLPMIGNVWAVELCAVTSGALAYGLRIPLEEKALRARFGHAYADYARQTRCLFPLPKRPRAKSRSTDLNRKD